MADNLALKLLVAGIIGAVVGAAAAERYHFPTGMVYGGFNNGPPSYRPPGVIDPNMGLGNVPGGERPPGFYERPPGGYGPPTVYVPVYPPPPPRYRPRPQPRTAWCWKETENWDFGMTGHYVRCPAGRARRSPREGWVKHG